VDMLAAPDSVAFDAQANEGIGPGMAKGKSDGIFRRFKPSKTPAPIVSTVLFKLIHTAGPAREIPVSEGKFHIALAPTDADFTNAAVWRITLPTPLNMSGNPRLRIHYAGDVARVILNGKLLDDQFYNGRSFEIGLKRYDPAILSGDLRLEILPLRRDAPVYMTDEAKPSFGQNASIAQIQSLDIARDYEVNFTPAMP